MARSRPASIAAIRSAGPEIELTCEHARDAATATSLLADDTEIAFMNGLPAVAAAVEPAALGADRVGRRRHVSHVACLDGPGHRADHGDRRRLEQHRRVRPRGDPQARPSARCRDRHQGRASLARRRSGLPATRGRPPPGPDARRHRVRRRRATPRLARARVRDVRPCHPREHPAAAPAGTARRASSSPTSRWRRSSGPEGLDELLETSDHVVIAVPRTPATEGLIGRDQLARMKPTSHLVNIARGGIVDEVALAEALRRGRPGVRVARRHRRGAAVAGEPAVRRRRTSR